MCVATVQSQIRQISQTNEVNFSEHNIIRLPNDVINDN